MKMHLIPLCLAALFVFVVSCKHELDQPPPTEPPGEEKPDTIPPAPIYKQVLASIQGLVSDENGDPMQNATVRSGNKTAITNEYGVFRITNVLAAEDYSYVMAEKEGYFNGSRTIVSQEGGTGFVRIKMMRKMLKGEFNAVDGGAINMNSNASVQFPSNAFLTKSGQQYNGKVEIYGAVLDPEANDFNETMPGDLRGITTDSIFAALKSYGMLSVALESDLGQPLQLAQGKTAVIKIKPGATLASSAPAEIPLWYFSETDGLWREEGKALLENGTYSGSVAHFSTWNFDNPVKFVYVKLRVKGMKGEIRPYSRVKIIDTRSKTYSDQYTDSAGFMETWVPKGVPLEIRVLTECGAALFSKEAGPFVEDADMGTVTVGWGGTTVVSGKIYDCNNQPVKGGYAHLSIRGLYYTSEIIDGEFTFYTSKCESGGHNVQLYFTENGNDSRTLLESFMLSDQNKDFGIIKNCETVPWKQYLSLRAINDSIFREASMLEVHYRGFPTMDSVTWIKCENHKDARDLFSIEIQFRDSTVHTSVIDNPWNVNLRDSIYHPVAPLVVNVKKYGPVEGEVFLTFSGTYQNATSGLTGPLIGEMRVVRRE